LAALELKEAGDTLIKADDASVKFKALTLSSLVLHGPTSKWASRRKPPSGKRAELAVANASAKRTEVRLEGKNG